LTDVDISALANGQILQYNSTTSKWENVDRTDIDLDQLGDVTIVSPTNGQVLVYNSSTSKWENSSGGFVPYTGAVTTVNLGAQSILAGSFVKAGGTSAQFLKADGSVDSTAYGTGSVTSVALTMPTAFSVAGSPVTTAGTLAVTATGTTSQYIRGDGSLATFPSLTGFVPYTGATADVNLGTHDLTAERGTFANNGSSDTLTVNHTSGSGYGIIVTKGGNGEALYVSKTTGSGNAMTVIGGRTSLVDLALSSVTNTAGDFLTLSGGVVHKRTAAEVRTDIGAGTVTSVAALTLGTSGTDLSSTVANGTTTPVITLNVPTASATNRGALSSADWTTFNNKQNALTNPVTGTGTTNTLAKFTGSTTIGNSLLTDNGTNAGYNNAGVAARTFIIQATSGRPLALEVIENANVHAIYLYPNNSGFNRISSDYMSGGVFLPLSLTGRENNADLVLQTSGNVTIGTTTDAGFKLDVNGTGRFSSGITSTNARFNNTNGPENFILLNDGNVAFGAALGLGSSGDFVLSSIASSTLTERFRIARSGGAATFSSLGTGTVTATAGTLSTVSDMYYKIDDGFIDSAIEKVLSLKPRYFYWNEKSGLPKDIRQLGFYAQEVNEALGEEAANTPQDKNTPWGISDRSIIAMLTKAIQELKQEIDTLKN
jgi:hypothetical protein